MPGNIDILSAMICSNQPDELQRNELKNYLDVIVKDRIYEDNKKICSKVLELSAMLSRFKPMNDKLHNLVE